MTVRPYVVGLLRQSRMLPLDRKMRTNSMVHHGSGRNEAILLPTALAAVRHQSWPARLRCAKLCIATVPTADCSAQTCMFRSSKDIAWKHSRFWNLSAPHKSQMGEAACRVRLKAGNALTQETELKPTLSFRSFRTAKHCTRTRHLRDGLNVNLGCRTLCSAHRLRLLSLFKQTTWAVRNSTR